MICDSHHQVLPYWLRAARDGSLPASGVRVVHLDSHPDLAVPMSSMPPQRSRDPDALLGAVDIATFQLAAAWVGLTDHVVWVRPPFAKQLPDGELHFRLGTDAAGLLRVDDENDYYVLDEGWAPTASLRDAVPVRVSVVPVGDTRRVASLIEGPTILDIDLDAFATRNPAAERLRRAGLPDADLDQLRDIFAPEHLRLAADPQTRIEQLNGLLEAIGALAAGSWHEWPGALVTLWRTGVGPRELFVLYGILGRAGGDLALDPLLEDGRDLVGLPERIHASPEAIAAQAVAIRDWVRGAPGRPALVTVSRSVVDGYTPRAVWPQAEWATLLALRDALGEVRIVYDRNLAPAPRVPADSAALRPFRIGP